MGLSWTARLTNFFSSSSRLNAKTRRGFQPRLEALEERLALATRIWDGGSATSSNWTDRFNWDQDTLPLPGDSLIFPAAAARKTGQVNDFPDLVEFNSLRYEGSGYSASGNRITLGSGGITTTNTTGSNTLTASLTLPALRTLTIGAGGTLALSGNLHAPNAGFTKVGTGTLELGGAPANTNTGTVTVNAGVLRLAKSSVTTAIAGTLIIGDGLGGNAADVVVLNSSAAIDGAVTIQSSGLLNLNNRSDGISSLTMNAGRVQTGTGTLGVLGTLTATSVPHASARIDGKLNAGQFIVNDGPAASDLLVTAVVSGTNVTKGGTGRMTFSGANTYTGATTVNAGALDVQNAAGLGEGNAPTKGTTVANGATLEVTGAFTLNEDLTLAGNGVGGQGALVARQLTSTALPVRFTRPVTLTADTRISTLQDLNLQGVISGNFGLTKNGAKTLRLFGANTYTGTTTILQGTLLAGNAQALGAASAGTIVSSGTTLFASFNGSSAEPLSLAGAGASNQGAIFAGFNSTFTGPVTLTGNTTLRGALGDQFGSQAATLTFSGAISGNFELIVEGIVNLTGSSANTHALTRVRGNGILTANRNANVASLPGSLVIESPAAVFIKSPGQIPDNVPVTINGPGVEPIAVGGLFVDAAETIGALTLNGGQVTGNAQLTLNGNVTSSGQSGLGGNISLGSLSRIFTVTSGTLRHRGFVGLLSGTGGIIKAGPGLLALDVTNTYTGSTSVNAGTLFVKSSLVSPITVAQGATLIGQGRNSGAVDQLSAISVTGGTLNPGDDPSPLGIVTSPIAAVVGTMRSNGAVTLSGQSRFHFDIGGVDPGTQHDQFQVLGNGSLDLGNSRLEIALVGGFLSAVNNTYTLIRNDTANLTAGFFTDPATQAIIPQGGEFFVGGQKFRMNYNGGDFNDVVVTHINSGAAYRNRTISSVINEGGEVVQTGTIVEPDRLDEFFLDVNWGDGETETIHVLPGEARRLRLTHRYMESGHYDVALSWHDQHGAGNSATMAVEVRNVAPRVQVDPFAVLTVDEMLDRVATFVDPGEDSWAATVDYGDGGGVETVAIEGDRTVRLSHTYEAPGTYRVSVRVTDDEGAVGRASFLVVVL